MYINKKAVKKFFNSNNKRIKSEVLDIVNRQVEQLLTEIVNSTKNITTIRGSDIV